MAPARLAKLTAKIAGVQEKEQFRAHQTYLLDLELLSDFQSTRIKKVVPEEPSGPTPQT